MHRIFCRCESADAHKWYVIFCPYFFILVSQLLSRCCSILHRNISGLISVLFWFIYEHSVYQSESTMFIHLWYTIFLCVFFVLCIFHLILTRNKTSIHLCVYLSPVTRGINIEIKSMWNLVPNKFHWNAEAMPVYGYCLVTINCLINFSEGVWREKWSETIERKEGEGDWDVRVWEF